MMKRVSRGITQIDWALFALRWIVLGAVTIAVFLGPDSAAIDPLFAGGVLGAAALYNILVGLLLFSGAWLALFPPLTLGADILIAVAIFPISNWSFNVMVWAALFPTAIASLRLGWVQGLVAAVFIVAADTILVFLFDPARLDNPFLLLSNSIFLLAATVLSGVVAERVRLLAIKRTHIDRDSDEKRIKRIRESAHAIYEMAELVSANINYGRVLDAALDISSTSVSDTGGAAGQMVSAALLFHNSVLTVETARRFTPTDLKVSLPGQVGVLAEAINSGEAAFSTTPFRDPELSLIVAFRNCRASMVVPLRAGLDTYGAMVFGHARPDFFDLDHIELLEAICKHTVIAMQNAKLYQRLLEEKERIVEVEEEARKKLARDLHDGPTQSVAAIAMRANYIRRLLEREPKSAGEELYKVEELARKTTKEIRHMLFTLRPLVLESKGLVAALQSLAEKMRENYNLNVLIEPQSGAPEKLDMHQQGVLFYIVEEAVGNARKHAEAEHIWVRMKLHSADVFALEIHDDGVGFDVGAVTGSYENRGSLGMVNMRERTELVNGALSLESAPGKGTRITVLVPLSDEARERLNK
ncbi:MAG: sensor histidine kinase [Chloroflexota bacterium]